MNTIIKILLLLVVLVPAGMLGTVLKNRVPLMDDPGIWDRLKVYLNTNVAQTRTDHPFPEMRGSMLPGHTMPLARQRVRDAFSALNWVELPQATEAETLNAVVSTSLLRFKDDVQVTLAKHDEGVRVDVRSASRIGRSDMGANQRHILDLYAVLGI